MTNFPEDAGDGGLELDAAQGVSDASTSVDGQADVATTDGAAPRASCADDARVVRPTEGGSTTLADAGAVGPYVWKNVAILGGGFVSGVVFSSAAPDIVYARTDVGGGYRWDPTGMRWLPVLDWVNRDYSNWMGVESIAPDPVNPDRVYFAAGEYLTAGAGIILRSDDRGSTWRSFPIPVQMGGNVDGRSIGERLAIDPNLTSTLYFAARNNKAANGGTGSGGLWRSTDSGATWSAVASFPAVGDPQYGLSFVLFDEASGCPGAQTPTIYVGVATLSGPNLYRSTDAGATWQVVPGPVLAYTGADGGMTSLMAHHAAIDSVGTLYVAFNNNQGPNNITYGGVWKLDTKALAWTDITPAAIKCDGVSTRCGYGGLSIDRHTPGTVLVSTLDWWNPDRLFRSKDGGATWVPVTPTMSQPRPPAGQSPTDQVAQFDTMGAEWLYFGGSNLSATGWAGDVNIDPFHPDRAVYITGQGIWWSDDLGASDMAKPVHWAFRDQGLEETVVLDLISPPDGAHLMSAVGDIGGFRHDDLDMPPSAGMSRPVFSNTSAMDFAEKAPLTVVRVGTANNAGRGAYSIDGGTTWTLFPTGVADAGVDGGGAPPGLRGGGTVAVSADGNTFLWAPQAARNAPVAAIFSRDQGATWTRSSGLPSGVRVASDRVNPSTFYAFGGGIAADAGVAGVADAEAGASAAEGGSAEGGTAEGGSAEGGAVDAGFASGGGTLYVSKDGGATFNVAATGLPSTQGRPRPVPGVEGDVWVFFNSLPMGNGVYRYTESRGAFTQVTGVQAAWALGFGKAAPGQTYPAVYVAGNGAQGVLRSDDAGATWQTIDDAAHHFGFVQQITGDPRVYGRVYLGTGGRGILYGDLR